MVIYWLYLFGAILLEVVGTTCIKFSEGFTKALPTAIVIITYILSSYLLSLSVRKIDVSTAYAIWAGLGIVCISIIGIYLFEDGMDWVKAAFIALILIGVVGLNLTESH
ncbi:MAG: small multidrug resistance pump [Alphaproteobacteria bacterium]|jgi:small multidrug resistance pump